MKSSSRNSSNGFMNDDDDMGQMLDDPSSQRPSITMSVDDLDFGDDGVFDEWLVGNNHYDGMLSFPPSFTPPPSPLTAPSRCACDLVRALHGHLAVLSQQRHCHIRGEHVHLAGLQAKV